MLVEAGKMISMALEAARTISMTLVAARMISIYAGGGQDDILDAEGRQDDGLGERHQQLKHGLPVHEPHHELAVGGDEGGRYTVFHCTRHPCSNLLHERSHLLSYDRACAHTLIDIAL